MRIRAVGVLVKDNKVLLLRRLKNGREYFVYPGGGVDEGETIQDAVTREIREELNLEVANPTFLFSRHSDDKDQEEHYFLITSFSGTPEIGGPEKLTMNENNLFEPYWASFDAIQTMETLYPHAAWEKISNFLNQG